ncbi:FAD-dependent monooxygenase [Nocardia jiangxiensis]|uniref:FAD-dependent monooxygenase n=1 Tax=Nocardia jiangxiensis TaxID=282685 RepID=UPI000312B798|nr:FAD-dependent monooxygenase [Nocardia jiangxiensis]
MSTNTDRPAAVAVLGNGPVGQTAALLLARWGVPVILLDDRPHRDPIGSKAICQQRDVLDIWESVGVGHRVAREGLTWTTARTFYRDHELFAYSLPDPGRSVFPPFVNISQARTESLLDERIRAHESIDVRWEHRVVAIDQNDERVRIACETPGGSVDVAVGYAVACAGARGEDIRGMLGLSFDGHSFDDRFLICDIRAELPGWADERRFYFDPEWNPGRQVLIHPCPESTFRIDWQVPADYDLAAEEQDGGLDARIRAIIGDRSYEIVWKSVYRFHSRVVDRMRVGRVLIAGDCAHLVSPFGARGLNSGVADAENAAWKLAYVLYGWAGDVLLDSYHDERHAAALENLEVTTATMDFLVPQTEDQRRRRLVALGRADADPSYRARVDSGRLAEPFWYVDSPLTTLDPARLFGGRPARGSSVPAGPGILVPDVPIAPVSESALAAVRDAQCAMMSDGWPALVSGAERGSASGAPYTGTGMRLRAVARSGLLILAGPKVDPVVLEQAAGAAAGPVRVVDLAEIDPGGTLTHALGAGAGEVWVIRPDAHVAAVLDQPDTARLAAALRRALGAGMVEASKEVRFREE